MDRFVWLGCRWSSIYSAYGFMTVEKFYILRFPKRDLSRAEYFLTKVKGVKGRYGAEVTFPLKISQKGSDLDDSQRFH